MNNPEYNDDLIIEYLLGSLSAQETERLDELSFTDEEFAVRLQAVENDLVDAYVRGELSGRSLERFNSYYLASPRRREKVAIARSFRNLADRAVITESAASGGPGPKRGFLYRFFMVPRPALQWGLAAAMAIILAAGGWLAVENLRLRNQIDQSQSERIALEQREKQLQAELEGERESAAEKERQIESLRESLARLERQPAPSQSPSLPDEVNVIPFTLAPQPRSAGQLRTLQFPGGADYLTLQLVLETGDHAFYRAELKSLADGKTVWRSGRLEARARDEGPSLIVTLRPRLLGSQRYILEVFGVSADGREEIVSGYPFRVVKQ
ncbi:MAG TPA: hypothetical protein VNO14_16125 [Blastocatellia bacterium]|nr:hypothetical protein [Blastocatellia bacterium]